MMRVDRGTGVISTVAGTGSSLRCWRAASDQSGAHAAHSVAIDARSCGHLHGGPPGAQGVLGADLPHFQTAPLAEVRAGTAPAGDADRTAAAPELAFTRGDCSGAPRGQHARAANGMMPRVITWLAPALRHTGRGQPTTRRLAGQRAWRGRRACVFGGRRSSWTSPSSLASDRLGQRGVEPTSRLPACAVGCRSPRLRGLSSSLLCAATREELIGVRGFIALGSVYRLARQRLGSQE